ncbi:MAG: serpin family protein, partial [Vicinamibacterales bacterium]
DAVAAAFHARSESRDFADPATLAAINAWVEDHTDGLIDTIVDQLDPSLVMLLVNAIYFNGAWTTQFDPQDTRTQPFARENASTVNVEMMSLTDVILEQNGNLLRQGAILVDPADEGTEPHLLFLLMHEIKSGENTLSKRLQFVRVRPNGDASFAGWAPHLDLEPLDAADRPLLDRLVKESWISVDLEQKAQALAAATLVPTHFAEVASRRIAHVDKTLAAVHERLNKEIAYWSDRWMKLKEDAAAGKDVRLNVENARRTVLDLEGRLENRRRELQAMRHVASATPIALGGALVVPAGLLRYLRTGGGRVMPMPPPDPDEETKKRIEMLAMVAVQKAEEARGCRVVDVSADKCGWDLTSYPPPVDGKYAESRHIEVKGRIKGGSTICVTRNEILYALNQADRFVLAIVLVGEDDSIDGPWYVRNPFDSEPGWGVSSINYDTKALLKRAERA